MAVIHASDADTALDFAATRETRNLWVDAWRRLRRNKLAVFGVVVLFFLTIVALAAPLRFVGRDRIWAVLPFEFRFF